MANDGDDGDRRVILVRVDGADVALIFTPAAGTVTKQRAQGVFVRSVCHNVLIPLLPHCRRESSVESRHV